MILGTKNQTKLYLHHDSFGPPSLDSRKGRPAAVIEDFYAQFDGSIRTNARTQEKENTNQDQCSIDE